MKITEARFREILRESRTETTFARNVKLLQSEYSGYTCGGKAVNVPMTLSFSEPRILYVSLNILIYRDHVVMSEIEVIDLDQFIADSFEVDERCSVLYNKLLTMINHD